MSDTIRQELLFLSSTGPKIEIEIPQDADSVDKLTLTLRALLSPEIADALKVPYIYAEGSVPQSGFKDIKLTAKFSDVELKLIGTGGDLDSIFPEKIAKFKIARIPNVSLGVQMEVETSGSFDAILDFFRSNRTGFNFLIRARQGNLFVDIGDAVVAPTSQTDRQIFIPGGEPDLPGSIAPAPKRGRGRPPKAKPEPVTVN